MEALTPETIAWAQRIGLSPERVAFLAACPKFTRSGEHMSHKLPTKENPNRYIMRSGMKYYFRNHSLIGNDSIIPLGPDIDAARKRRDELVAELRAKKLKAIS